LLFQHASELAIRATLFLAQQAPGKLSPVHEIAADAGVSEAYLAKILQRLASSGMVRSFRGPGNGMELGRAPEAISLNSVIRAVEGTKEVEKCVLGLGTCSEVNPCALHKEWLPLRLAIQKFLDGTTLADLVKVAQNRPQPRTALLTRPKRPAIASGTPSERKQLR
jgi:Rrf2 family iron-sulfur cluster assembly transcriptional regulator